MFTIVGEMRDEMAGTPSTSGCCAAFFLPQEQSTPRRSPALTMSLQRCAITYIRTLRTHPVLILVTCPSCVNLANSIKCVGDSLSYLLTAALIMRSLFCGTLVDDNLLIYFNLRLCFRVTASSQQLCQ